MQERRHAFPFGKGIFEFEHLVLKVTHFLRYQDKFSIARNDEYMYLAMRRTYLLFEDIPLQVESDTVLEVL